MDERLKWLETRVSSSLRPRNEELKNMFVNDENRLAFHEFINNEDVRRLFVYIRSPKEITASLLPPHDMNYKSIFFLKCNAGTKLTKDNIGDEVFFIDCTSIPLEHCELIVREVYLPLMCTNQANIVATGGDRIMDTLHRLMSVLETTQGHVEGRIILSLPSIEVLAEAAASQNRRGAVLHVLETTVLGWIKQIKSVLRHDPVADLAHHYGTEPEPLDEVKMWESQLDRLHSILKQLESPVAKDILQNLEHAQSQYAHSFTFVRKDVNKAVSETNRILKFLETMNWLFESLHNAFEPKHMLQLFKPLMQTLLLVWSNSTYYHQLDKYHNMLRLLSNEVVHRAIDMVGEDILREPLESYTKLKEALRVCAAFRGTYLDYKDRADELNTQNIAENAERLAARPQGNLFLTKMYGPHAYTPRYGMRYGEFQSSTDSLNEEELWVDSPWPPRNAPCFDLLNSFMERCNDVLELVETTRHFRLLAGAAEVGGAGSMSLDALVKEIHEKYTNAMSEFFSVVDNVLNIDGSQNFERAFFKFRTVVKALERRLAEILRLSYNQCPTVEAQLRLLEVFEGVSSRELVQAHLKDKDKQLVRAFTEELIQVRSMFDDGQHNPPCHINMPPVVSKLMWVQALQERIRRPMNKLKRVSPHSMEGDSGWQMRDAYNECMHELEGYQKLLVQEWQNNITFELTTRLKQPLLIAEEYDEDVEVRPQVVHVNLDPHLLRIMRESHYLSEEPFCIKLPEAAKELLRNTNAFELRVTATRLETIVSKYNAVMRTLTEFEKPLFERKLAKIDTLFELGLQQYTWKMKESTDFIEQAMALVCVDVHQNLDIVQTNSHDVAEITISWSLGTLDVFSARDQGCSYSMEELLELQRSLTEEHENLVVPSGYRIHSLVTSSFEAVQISQASPAWQDYLDYIDAIVLDGLKQATLTSLKFMLNNLVHSNMAEDEELLPILTIRLELIDNRVSFRPPLDQNTSIISVQELVQGWLDGFLARGKLVKMLGPKGTYQDYISADEEVHQLLSDIQKLVRENSEECKKLLEVFGDYSFLWLQDVIFTFEEFLRGKITPNPLRSPNRTLAGHIRQTAAERSTLSRVSSASSIQSAGIMGTAERSFLTPKNLQEGDLPENMPSLDEFDSEIDIYRTARDEIQSLDDYHNVGWLRVDLQPIKQVLTTYASKWMWTFTAYLSDQVTQMLEKLDQFLKRIEPEIESITGEERDTVSFMKMMRLFNEVSAQQSEMDGKFAAMHRTVLLLKKYGQVLPDKTQQLFSAAPGRWNNLKTKVSLAKQRLGPRIQEESIRITQDLEAFGDRVLSLSGEMEASDVYSRECNLEEAWGIIDDFIKRLTVLENEAQDLIELQELLEANVVNFSVLPQCHLELNNLKQVYETARVITDQQAEWKRHRWQKMDTKFLREETNKQLDIVKSLPESIFTWDVYIGLHESITTIQACLPLIEDLSNPAMRTRHWKQLVRVIGGALTIDNDTLKKMTLGELLSLGLQKHVDDVRGIVQRAVKDLSIEQSLKTYEEVWLSKIFELQLHIRSKFETPTDPDAGDNQSEYSQSETGASQHQGMQPSRSQVRTTSRVSKSSSHSKNKRSSLASLPDSLLNLGESETGQLFLLTNTDPIFEELEHHQVSLQAMQSNSAAGSFLDEVVKWQKRLQTIEAVLSTWLQLQEKWVELEEIYSSAEVRTCLAHDSNRFAVVNHDFRLLMKATEKNPNVLQCCSRKSILAILEHMDSSLDTCKKSLLNHLERRRQIFPRFYFLSMDDVLHIVCNGYDLNQVNLFISKLFEHVGSLDFEEVDEEDKYYFFVKGVQSFMGEMMPFNQPMICDGQIENWLSNFTNSIKATLQQQLASALGYEKLPSLIVQAALIPASPEREAASNTKNMKDEERNASNSRNSSRGGSRQDRRRGSVSQKLLTEEVQPDSHKSWTLDHVSEIVYLATQCQLTSQIKAALAEQDLGSKEALKNVMKKINNNIETTTLLLKGLEGDKDLKRSEAHSQRDEVMSESASLAGPKSSNAASLAAASRKGSMFDITGQSPIQEEHEVQDEDKQSLVEPQTMEPVDTMNILDMPLPTAKKEEEVEEVVEEDTLQDVKLMLFPSQIQKLSTLLSLLAHLRDLLQRLSNLKQTSVSQSLLWKAQLQYSYKRDSQSVTVKCMNAEFDYGFEYLGSSRHEVLTPLTDRVFVSLTQAVVSHIGALLVGPMYSGKFGMVLELSRSLGHPIYKFNCTSSMDYCLLQDIFRGMASTGCWIFFNNINHLDPSVLSVFAQLLSAVMDALRAKKAAVHLQSDDVQLNPQGACFALLESTIRARSTDPDKLLMYTSATASLPDYILKAFRLVSVVKPDLQVSLEVMLFSHGFVNGQILAHKTMMLIDMCGKLLGTNAYISENIGLGSDVGGLYGWSYRILKGVVAVSGDLLEKLDTGTQKSSYSGLGEKEEENKDGVPNIKLQFEEEALVTALRDTYLPRLQGQDSSIFAGLITDLWPNVNIPLLFEGDTEEVNRKGFSSPVASRPSSSRIKTAKSMDSQKSLRESIPLNTPVVPFGLGNHDHFNNDMDNAPKVLNDVHDAIAVATGDLGLLPGVSFQARVAQLTQLSCAHQAIFVVGPSGCGKSECIKTFAMAERERGRNITVQTVFVKAVESEQLMGYVGPKNREWKDGLLTSLLRKSCLQPASLNYDVGIKPTIRILQLDGEADPHQMELLQTVLVHEGAVVLGNNERIVMPDTVKFVWEMENLGNLSPALLASVGVLMMNMTDVGWRLMLVQWLQQRPEEDREMLTGFCDVYIDKCVEYLSHCTQPHMFGSGSQKLPHYKRIIPHTIENMISTFGILLEALVAPYPDLSDMEYERYFNFACIWAFGGTLAAEHRESFSNWWCEEFDQHIDYPVEGTVFDYIVDSESHEFCRWADILPAYSSTPHKGIPPDAFVHTVNVEQLGYLLGLLSDVGKPVLLVGENGCGKTSIVNDRIRTVCSGEVAEVLSLSLQANRFTNSELLYKRLDERLEWKHGRTYIPKGNKKLLCLVDDINLSQVDRFGHQTAIELIRQHIDDGGFFNTEKQTWRYVKNVTYVSTINPCVTANVPKLNQRFLRHFAVLGCPYPGTEELQTIFSILLHTQFLTPETSSSSTTTSSTAHHLGIHDDKAQHTAREEEELMKKQLNAMVKVNVELQERLRTMFLPTAQRCHYIFSMRDLGNIFKNVCLSLQPGCSRKNLLLLWQHECYWVYGHRMVSEVDYRRFKQAFVTAVKKEFTDEEQIQLLIKSKPPLFSNLIEQDSGIVTAGMIDTRHSASVSEADTKTDLYRPVFNFSEAKELLERGVEEYNKIHPRIKMSLYKSAVEQVCRLARTIPSPHESAHCVLVAEGCPGRSTVMVKLASHLCGYAVYQINPSPMTSATEYKMDMFKADLVQGYTRAGTKGEKIVLLLHEEELLQEDYLVFLIEFVVSGSISHLFSPEEQTTIINSIRTEVTQAGLTYTRDVAWDFFLKTVRNNFRVCLITADGGQNFQHRCREYPAFTKNVNFLWFPHWSKTQLVEHVLYLLKEIDWLSDIQKENIAHLMASMHLVLRQQDGQEKDSGEYRHITNTTFEKFIERFVNLANTRNMEISEVQQAVTKSLQQIQQENEVATKLRKQLEHEMVVLDERKAGTVKILSQIGQDTAITEQQIKVVRSQMDKIQKLKKLLPEYQVAHERAVYKAIAIVADSKKVVQNMNIEKLAELRAMQKPVIDTEDLMAAIIMILKSPSADLTWQKGAKRQMANLERFIEELMTFDDNQMPEQTLSLVEPYLKKPSFDPETLERKTGNSACGSLCRWVRGVVRYHRMMISKVKPLHQKVEETTQAVDDAEHKMLSLENKHKALEVRLADLARGFEEATIDKNEQDDKTVKMRKMLETAAQLRKILRGERQRCQQIFDSHERRLTAIPGGCAMAAAFTTYLGPYHHPFRRMMLTIHWPNCLRERGIPLVIDSIDALKGRVIDWSIDFLKTASGASEVYEVDYTAALLATGDTRELLQSPRTKEDNDGEKDAEQEEREIPDEEDGEGETKTADRDEKGSPKPEESEDQETTQDGQLTKFQEEVSVGGEEGEESQMTESSQPMLSTSLYTKYVRSLIKLLVGDFTLNNWIRKDIGLRQMENIAIVCTSWQRPPMLIDPNQEGSQWLKRINKLLSQRKLVFVDMDTRWSDPQVILNLEKAIIHGKPVLLYNCEEHIDNVITPLMHHRNTASSDGAEEEARMIKFCGRRILCHPDFRFFLSTPIPKPKFNPEISSTTTLINFGVSHDTLIEDILTRSFARIRPDLYKEHKIALHNVQLNKETLLHLSETIKRKVLSNQHAIVSSPKALKFITDITKAKIELANRLNDIQQLLTDLDLLKEELFPLARRAAMLYSILRSLQSLRNEYQFSLKFFVLLFDEAVGGELPPEFMQEDEEIFEEEETITFGDKSRPRVGSSTSNKSRESGVDRTTDKSTEQGMGTKGRSKSREGDYEPDFEDSSSKTPKKATTSGESASTGAAQQLVGEKESEDLPPLELPETIPLPSDGVEYRSLSANQIKQMMDKLTGLVYRRIRESLYEEDCLLFATLLCLSIQSEGGENFTAEEMSLLLQGNPGLGMQLTLGDFDSKDLPPDWLPKEKWEDILALSVLPGPLDSLCVHIAQESDAWKSWYKSQQPDSEPLPLTPNEAENTTLSNGQNGQMSPDLGSLTDFHQLLLLRMLRPDRLPSAMSKYVNKHLSLNLPEQTEFNVQETLENAKHHWGILLLLPPSPGPLCCPVTRLQLTDSPVKVLKLMAKAMHVEVEHIKLGQGCEMMVEEAIDSAEKSDGWVLIEDLHTAPTRLFNELRKHLVRVAKTRDNLPEDKKKASKFCMWITSEPSNSVPNYLFQNLLKVSWNYVTVDLLQYGSRPDTLESTASKQLPLTIHVQAPERYLHTAIMSTLKQVDSDTWTEVHQESQLARTIVYGFALIQGILVSRQLFGAQGLSQWYPFNDVLIKQAIGFITGNLLKAGDDSKLPDLEDLCHNITMYVYQNALVNQSDKEYVDALIKHVIRSLYTNTSGFIAVGATSIPVPPANIDPSDFSSWYEKSVAMDTTLDAIQLHNSVAKLSNETSAIEFMRNLDQMFETQNMEAGEVATKAPQTVNIIKLRSALDLCVDNLPQFLELGQVPQLVSKQYDFPYHRPSIISLFSTSGTLLPETVGYVLLQECLWLNSILCHIRQQISDLQQNLLGGPAALPQTHMSTVIALQEEHVPVSWVHPNSLPCTHSLVSFLDDMKNRFKQLQSWVKHGMVPTFNDAGVIDNQSIGCGPLTTLWLGGLNNPMALLTALKQEKAMISQCSVDQVEFECVPVEDSEVDTDKYTIGEGSLFLTELHLQGASWDYTCQHGSLSKPESPMFRIPYMYLKAVVQSEKSTAESSEDDNKAEVFNCPVYVNQSRQVMAAKLPLSTSIPPTELELARAAIILDPGLPEDGVKKSRSYLLLQKEPQMLPTEETVSVTEDDEAAEPELAALGQEAEEEVTDTEAGYSEQSQLSYRPLTPKAAPLPPGMGLTRDEPLANGQQPPARTKLTPSTVEKSSPIPRSQYSGTEGTQKSDRKLKTSKNTAEKTATPRTVSDKRTVSRSTEDRKPSQGTLGDQRKNSPKVPVRASPASDQAGRKSRESMGSRGSKRSVGSKTKLKGSDENQALPSASDEGPVTQIEIEPDTEDDQAKVNIDHIGETNTDEPFKIQLEQIGQTDTDAIAPAPPQDTNTEINLGHIGETDTDGTKDMKTGNNQQRRSSLNRYDANDPGASEV